MTVHALKTPTSVLESPNRFAEQFRAGIASASLRDLDNLARTLWKAHEAGTLADDQAQQLAELIQRRRQPAGQSPRLLIMELRAAILHPAFAGTAIARPAGFASAATRACGDRAAAADDRGNLHHG